MLSALLYLEAVLCMLLVIRAISGGFPDLQGPVSTPKRYIVVCPECCWSERVTAVSRLLFGSKFFGSELLSSKSLSLSSASFDEFYC